MRHRLKIDGLRILDIGQAVSPVQLNFGVLGIPQELCGSVADFLFRWHPRLKTAALDCLLEQHALSFPYEDGPDALERLETLLSEQCAVPTQDKSVQDELWRFGDVFRLELILKAPAITTIDQTPKVLVEFAVTEMMRNAYRRLHALERPLTEHFFSVFLQTSQPTQIPLDVLHGYAVGQHRPTPADSSRIMKENGIFWKSELQSLGNQYLQATISDPKLMTLQNAALYQQLKRFFGEEV